MERTHLEMMKPPPPPPLKPRLHLYLLARWPPLDLPTTPLNPTPNPPLLQLILFHVPSVPCTPRDPLPPSTTMFYWPILLTYLSMCLHCSGTTAPLVGLTYSRASMCILNPFNHGKCSAGFTEFNPASGECCPCDDPTEHIPRSPPQKNTHNR